MNVKDKKPLEIIVTPENKQEFINFFTTVKNFADSGIDVPAGYVSRLLELMYDPSKIKKNLSWAEAVKCSAVACEKVREFKNYQFHWIDTQVEGSDEVIKNDTPKVFLEMIYAFFLFKNDNDIVRKDDAIAFFYQAFDDEYIGRLEPENQKAFTRRRQAILSGILAMSVEYLLTNKPNPTEEDIFQSTRNAIRKYFQD
jgi:hypothetical protein